MGEDAYDVIVILVDLPGGGHVASVPGFETYGQACTATCAHANLIANAPLLLALLRQARAALPDAWSAVKRGVPGELIEEIDAAAAATPPLSLPPTPPVNS